MTQGTLEQRYNIYLSCANDGAGRDITTGSRTWLKTFDQWLDGVNGDPCDPVSDAVDQAMGNKDCYQEELTPEGIQLVITGAERITEPTETEKQGSFW